MSLPLVTSSDGIDFAQAGEAGHVDRAAMFTLVAAPPQDSGCETQSESQTRRPARSFVLDEDRSSGRCVAGEKGLYWELMLPGQPTKKTENTRSPVNPEPDSRPETEQGGRTNGTAIWQEEESDCEDQEAEKADAHPAQADPYRIKVGRCRQK